MPYLNQVTIMGHMGKAPRVNPMSNGKNAANFSVAVDNGYMKDGEWQQKTVWLDIKAFGYAADAVLEAGKGSAVLVVGQIEEDKWEDKDSGQPRSKLVINARQVKLLDKKSKPSPDAKDMGAPVPGEDDVPF